MRPTLLAGFLLCAGGSFVGAQLIQPPVQPHLTFASAGVTATGLTPGGQVVFFSVAREVSSDEWVTVVPREALMTATNTIPPPGLATPTAPGTATYPLAGPTPPKSIWVAVDYATGKYALSVPAVFVLRQQKWRGNGLVRAANAAESDSVSDMRRMAEFLLVRPNFGAWRLRVGDGSPADLDETTNGEFTASLGSFIKLVNAPPLPPTDDEPLPPPPGSLSPLPIPAKFLPGDVLVMIDPLYLEVTVTTVTATGDETPGA